MMRSMNWGSPNKTNKKTCKKSLTKNSKIFDENETDLKKILKIYKRNMTMRNNFLKSK